MIFFPFNPHEHLTISSGCAEFK